MGIVLAIVCAVAIADQEAEESKHRGGYGGYRHGRSIADDVQTAQVEVAAAQVADITADGYRHGAYYGGYNGGYHGGYHGGYRGGYSHHRYGRSITDDVQGQEHYYGGYRGGYGGYPRYGGYSRYGGYPSYGHYGGYRGHY